MGGTRRLTQSDLQNIYRSGEKLVCLTAYTTPVARVLDKHCDLLLVGDSLGMVVYGMENTLGVTLDMMINHGKAVMRGVENAYVVVDMPYGSYEDCADKAVKNAQRVMDETGCDAIKIEGGLELMAIYQALADADIPTVAHIGLQPQSVVKEGGYKLKGRNDAETAELIQAAQEIEKTGVVALVIEGTVEQASRQIVAAVNIPTIGIGASPSCTGQILVSDDMLGLFVEHVPKFVKQYAQLAKVIDDAAGQYSREVRGRIFPSDAHVYKRAS